MRLWYWNIMYLKIFLLGRDASFHYGKTTVLKHDGWDARCKRMRIDLIYHSGAGRLWFNFRYTDEAWKISIARINEVCRTADFEFECSIGEAVDGSNREKNLDNCTRKENVDNSTRKENVDNSTRKENVDNSTKKENVRNSTGKNTDNSTKKKNVG
jgi:hypothetical protein